MEISRTKRTVTLTVNEVAMMKANDLKLYRRDGSFWPYMARYPRYPWHYVLATPEDFEEQLGRKILPNEEGEEEITISIPIPA